MAWGVADPTELRLLDPPTEAALTDAREVLTMLGAIDEDGRITTDGRHMLSPARSPASLRWWQALGDGRSDGQPPFSPACSPNEM